MIFSEMPYTRLDPEEMKAAQIALTERLTSAGSYEEAREAFLEKEKLWAGISTMINLAHIRHDVDTRDEYYDKEMSFWHQTMPELEEYSQAWTEAMLVSPWREDFEREYGTLMFLNAEIERKTFSPEIIPEMQKENELSQAYMKLIASARIPFEGGIYTLSQLTPFKTDLDDARRLESWKAEGAWYRENQPELDRIYDELVHLRDAMGKKLGYGGYIPLGYYRMGRNCYGQEEVESFRAAVRKYVVPLAEKVYRQQAGRLGKEYPMSFADNALTFRSGNPRPVGTAEDILARGQEFYDSLSPEAGEFFRVMRTWQLMDVLSTEGKASGGYCTMLADYKVPFIFANFNGTQGDVEVVTHEAGHAFAAYVNRDRVPAEYIWPGMESCEVHSMSMELLALPRAEGFFGPDTRKYQYSHIASDITFIPYGTMVDHFQHLVYENPEMTPEQRHETWKTLLGEYMPWMRLDGEIPVYGEGHGWQRQNHIYRTPFYYIDYCLAQTVALQIWSIQLRDPKEAWERYMAYTRQGGSRTFTELLENAGLRSPFDEECLRKVCQSADAWLEDFDLTGIE